MTISLCMIVKNEEPVLARCLDSAKDIADEIIIVDTGSTDRTPEIASCYGHVYDFEWIDDFSAARNYAYSLATQDYIMWLDADDVILPADREKLLALKATPGFNADAVLMPYHTAFDKQGRPTFTYYRERITNRACGFQWIEPVHEYLAWDGVAHYSDAAVTHMKEQDGEPGRNLRIYQRTIREKGELSPRGTYYYARELYYNGDYHAAIGWFQRFLDCYDGWVEDKIQACLLLARCCDRPAEKEHWLLRSFEYAAPRPEVCCDLGYLYSGKGDYARALGWFMTALAYEPPKHQLGFVRPDYNGYIPAIEACLCAWHLGDVDAAKKYNRIAGQYKPGDPSVAYNERFFDGIKKGA